MEAGQTPGRVIALQRPQDPAIAEVVKLMEATDKAGRRKALEGVKAVLAFHEPPPAEGRILAFPRPGK